jgi:Na+/H+-dicarboxylate symporter
MRSTRSVGTQALAALVAGVIIGTGMANLPNPPRKFVESIAGIAGTLWINAILMTIVPLVVSKVIIVLASGANTDLVRRAGGRAAALMIVLLLIPGAISGAVMPPVFARMPVDPAITETLRARSAGTATPAPPPMSFESWITSLVPTNALKAAADGAMLPLLVFTIVFSLALGRLTVDRRQPLVRFFAAVDDTMTVVLSWIVAAAPIGVFALALGMMLQLGVSIVSAVLFYVVVASVAQVAFALALYPIVSLVGCCRTRDFARAAAPAQVMAFSTHSSLASLPALLEGAAAVLRLPSAVSGVVLPLAVAMFKYASPIWFLTVVCFVARLYGVQLDAPRLFQTVLVAVLASFTVGGVPSGSVYVVLPVMMAAGLPAESIGMLLAVDPIPNAFRTTANVTADMAVAALVGLRRGFTRMEAEQKTSDETRMSATSADRTFTRDADFRGSADKPSDETRIFADVRG